MYIRAPIPLCWQSQQSGPVRLQRQAQSEKFWVVTNGKFTVATNTGAKTIPLNRPALEVLATAKRVEGNPYVITGTAEGAHLTDLQKPWRRVRKAAGLGDVRIHDLRHTFASEAVMGGESLPMVGRILGHTQAQTTARYAHLADDPLQKASERIASSLKQAMDG